MVMHTYQLNLSCSNITVYILSDQCDLYIFNLIGNVQA